MMILTQVYNVQNVSNKFSFVACMSVVLTILKGVLLSGRVRHPYNKCYSKELLIIRNSQIY